MYTNGTAVLFKSNILSRRVNEIGNISSAKVESYTRLLYFIIVQFVFNSFMNGKTLDIYCYLCSSIESREEEREKLHLWVKKQCKSSVSFTYTNFECAIRNHWIWLFVCQSISGGGYYFLFSCHILCGENTYFMRQSGWSICSCIFYPMAWSITTSNVIWIYCIVFLHLNVLNTSYSMDDWRTWQSAINRNVWLGIWARTIIYLHKNSLL